MINIFFSIEQFIDHNYITDIRENRRKGNNGTQEFFTPHIQSSRECGTLKIGDLFQNDARQLISFL